MDTTANIDRKELIAALTPLKTIITRSATFRALQCVKISYKNNTLEIVATDLETTITTTIPSASASASTKTGIVDYAALVKSIRAHKHKRITLTIGDDQILISSPTATTTLETADLDQWPNIPEIEHSPTPNITIDSAALTTALAQTLPSVGTDLARPSLNCIEITSLQAGGLAVKATDGYRAVIAEIDDRRVAINSYPIPPIVIPLKVAQAIKAAIITQGETTFQYATAEEDSTYRDLIVRIRDNNARITTDIQTETLCNPEYPNLQTIWDQPRNSIGKFNRQAMLAALKQVLNGNRTEDLTLRMEPDGGTHNLTLTIEHDGTTTTATVPYEGELVKYETSIGFNPHYFLAGIEAVCGEEIAIESETPMKPIVLKSTDTTTKYLLMPKRINQYSE
jgi:DNA polymerase III beta subunit